MEAEHNRQNKKKTAEPLRDFPGQPRWADGFWPGVYRSRAELKKLRAHQPCGRCALAQLSCEVFKASQLNLASR